MSGFLQYKTYKTSTYTVSYNIVYSRLYDSNEYNALYRPVVASLLHTATNVSLSIGRSEENGVGEDAINTQQKSVHVHA